MKFEINGTNSFKFENPMLVGNDQSNVSFIATGTSAATLRFWHKGNGANRLDLSVPFISGFKKLIKRAPNMDTLIAIGAAASLIYGIVALFMIFKMSLTY